MNSSQRLVTRRGKMGSSDKTANYTNPYFTLHTKKLKVCVCVSEHSIKSLIF